ncbi:MAG: helix-turn-helix domain-containing protein [Desulfobulbus sp.]|nr:helix-turn-helix domain-containing protein [Desulfobulbus sp.]
MDYETAEEAAKRWGISVRWVQALCRGRRIPGAKQLGRIWLIPQGAARPADQRFRPHHSKPSFQNTDETNKRNLQKERGPR